MRSEENKKPYRIILDYFWNSEVSGVKIDYRNRALEEELMIRAEQNY